MLYQKNNKYAKTMLFSCLTFSSSYLLAAVNILENGGTYQSISIAAGDEPISVEDLGRVLVENNGAAPGSNQRGVVELNTGMIDLGNGSTVNATGWGGSTSSGVILLGSAQQSTFSASNLTVNSSSTANMHADAVLGIGSLYSDSNSNTQSTINLTGVTVINVNVNDSSASTYNVKGIYLDGNGTALNAGTLNVRVSYANDQAPANPFQIGGIHVVRNGQTLSYNKANIQVNNSRADTEAIGIISQGTSITGADTTITMVGESSGQTLKGISAGSIDDTNSLMDLSGPTSINITSGGDNSTLTGIESSSAVSQFNQKNGTLEINLDSNGFANNKVDGLYTSSTGSALNNIDISTDSFVINNKNNVGADSHFIHANGGNINLATTGALNFIDLASTNKITDIVKASADGKVVINAQSANLAGNMVSADTGSIDFTSATGAFTGATQKATDGTINFNLGNGFVWNMTDNSTLSNLSLDGATVNFGKTNLRNTTYQTLTTDTLQGNGRFNLRTDIVGQQGDLIVVNGVAEGTHQLGVINNGASSTTGSETLTIVKTGTNNANFSLANKVEQGAYEYGLRAVANSPEDLELYALPNPNGGGNGNGGGGALTSTAEAASSFLNIGYLTNYIENQTLLQRLGDLRNSEAAGVKSNGLWIREFGGKLSAFSGSGLSGFDMSYTGTQLGIDKQIDVSNGNLLVGAMAGFTRTNPNYRRGDGNGKSYTGGLYATYFLDSGLYVDGVLKYNSMRNHFNVEDTAGNSVKGTGKTKGVMASVEVGQRFWLEQNRQGLYLEPQAQLSYGYQSGDSVHASNGLKVGLSHYNSTLGRASIVAGYQIKGENPINVYLKTGVVREMSGGASYRFNDGRKNNHSFRSSWFDNGVGANININKKHNIYAEADYS